MCGFLCIHMTSTRNIMYMSSFLCEHMTSTRHIPYMSGFLCVHMTSIRYMYTIASTSFVKGSFCTVCQVGLFWDSVATADTILVCFLPTETERQRDRERVGDNNNNNNNASFHYTLYTLCIP